MIEVELEREFELGADQVWAVIGDFGNVAWVPGVEKVELEGSGVGMKRHLTVPGMAPFYERLDAIDPAQMVLEYWIPAVEFLQIENYRARAQVFELEPGRCRVVWRCTAEAVGDTEEVTTVNTRAFYEALLGWVAAYLEKD